MMASLTTTREPRPPRGRGQRWNGAGRTNAAYVARQNQRLAEKIWKTEEEQLALAAPVQTKQEAIMARWHCGPHLEERREGEPDPRPLHTPGQWEVVNLDRYLRLAQLTGASIRGLRLCCKHCGVRIEIYLPSRTVTYFRADGSEVTPR